jgi:hypothetical protein
MAACRYREMAERRKNTKHVGTSNRRAAVRAIAAHVFSTFGRIYGTALFEQCVGKAAHRPLELVYHNFRCYSWHDSHQKLRSIVVVEEGYPRAEQLFQQMDYTWSRVM